MFIIKQTLIMYSFLYYLYGPELKWISNMKCIAYENSNWTYENLNALFRELVMLKGYLFSKDNYCSIVMPLGVLSSTRLQMTFSRAKTIFYSYLHPQCLDTVTEI